MKKKPINQPKRKPFFKRKNVLRIGGASLLVILLVGGYLFFELTTGRVAIDDSLISAPIITISPTTGGQLMEMDVTEGQMIKKGDTLATVGSETIHADTDGVIIMADNAIGSTTSTVTPLIEMIHTADIRVAGTIDENKGLNDIKIGQPVSFTVDAYPGKTYWGYVDEVSPSAKQTQVSFTMSSERPTQQFVVYARVNASAYPEIKNGMSAKMTVYIK